MEQKIPTFLEEVLKKEYSQEVIDKVLAGLIQNRKTTIRVNTLKTTVDNIKAKLKEAKIEFSGVEWSNIALIIENANEVDIRKLEMYENGEIYMQSLSSMIPPIILEPKEKESILDMAAAPGGKTTEMASLSNNLAMITACEKNKIRCDKLKYNLEKQGATRVTVMLEDARKLSDCFSFDKILLDAPCSGSGTINLTDINLNKYFSQDLIKRSVVFQKELINKASKIIKIGGEITYSTCSILKEENEDIVEPLIKSGRFEIVSIKELKGVPVLPTRIEGTLCVCPTELYEGFFVAKLRRIK